MPRATNLGKKMTFREGFPLITLHDSLFTQSCEIMWQIKNVVQIYSVVA